MSSTKIEIKKYYMYDFFLKGLYMYDYSFHLLV